jgi:fructose-1,6-bisphosphatase/inositol monophosphatase family enzyme
MCPFCFASVALVAVGTVSTGGVTALAINKLFRARKGAKKNTSQLKSKENAS